MKKANIYGPEGKPVSSSSPQIATRSNVGWTLDLLFNALPDPDLILRKLGRSISALREVKNDDQFETAWTSRLSAVTTTNWEIISGGTDKASILASEFITEQFSNIRIDDLFKQLAEYSLFGFQAAEIIWQKIGDKWGFSDIICKPQEWFSFDRNNNLLLKKINGQTEELPPNRFLLLQHRPSFINPYGEKLLSKLYWPYIFRKNGAQWWATFTEKFGSAFATAKYRPGSPEGEISDIINMLEELVSCGVAAFPDGTDINILTDTSKGAATNNFKEFQSYYSNSITKVILGATLTTDIGDVGSKSAAEVHNTVREDIALSDRKVFATAFNSLFRFMTLVNFGESAYPPEFVWHESEDLNTDKLERDVKLYSIGWRPKKTYIEKNYNISQDDFDLVSPNTDIGFSNEKEKHSFTEETENVNDSFNQHMFTAGQSIVNSLIDDYQNALNDAETYDQALQNLVNKYSKHTKKREAFAQVLDNIRFFASQIGCDKAKDL